MKKTLLISGVAALMATSLHLAHGQSPNIPRIGYLTGGSVGAINFEELRQALKELGYIEGKNVLLEPRYAEGKAERVDEFAKELVQLKVDIIVTASTGESLAAQRATSTIPIVMATGADPEAQGLVASLARPGGNITGLATNTAVLNGKRLELLKEIFPKTSLVAVLWDGWSMGHKLHMKATENAARTLGLRLHPVAAIGPDEFPSAFFAINRGRADSMIVLGTAIYTSHQDQIIDFAAKSRLPTVYFTRSFVDGGGLISYGPDFRDLSRRVAYYVDRILKGAKPADLPVEGPTKFELVINLKAAEQIGLTIPKSVLQRADRVIR